MSIRDLPQIDLPWLAPDMIQLAMNQLPQAIFWKDCNLIYLGYNQHFAEDALLATPAEGIGKTDHDMPWRAQAAAYGADDREVLDTGIAKLNIEQQQQRSDGTTWWRRMSTLPLRDATGGIVGLLGTYEDISDSKRIEAQHTLFQEQVLHMQQSMLAEFSTPLLMISDTILVMPLIGPVDTRRVTQMMETLLNGVSKSRASTVIIDITGVVLVDTQVADAFIRAAQAVSLLGARVVMTGIRPEVAQTLVQLGIDLHTIVTYSTLRDGIAYALHR